MHGTLVRTHVTGWKDEGYSPMPGVGNELGSRPVCLAFSPLNLLTLTLTLTLSEIGVPGSIPMSVCFPFNSTNE